VAPHRLDQQATAVDVDIPVAQRLLHRFTDGFEAGEVDHPVNRPACAKGAIEIGGMANVALDHPQTLVIGQLCQLSDPAQRLGAAVGKTVEYHQAVA